MNAHIEKMHAAKRAAEERRRREHRKQAKEYRSWLKRESHAYARRCALETIHGRDNDEFGKANRTWHELLRKMPAPPPDHADWSNA